MGIPKEVQSYFENGRRRLINITPNDDYSLTLEFDNGEIRVYEMKNSLTGVLAVLKDKEKFREVFVDEFGNIAWDIDCNIDSNLVYNNRIDLSADNAYIYGKRPFDALSGKL